MATMTKRKYTLLFEGEFATGAPGFTKFNRFPDGCLGIGQSPFRTAWMTLSPSQAVALRKWLEATEKHD